MMVNPSCMPLSFKLNPDLGVTALPPMSFGFAHMTSNPFYLYQGTLYKVPTSEKEHGHFRIDMATIPPAEVAPTSRPLHPKGGHNYYAGRDMEKLQRRLKSIAKDVAKAAYQPADTGQPYRRDYEPRTSGWKGARSSDFLQRRYSSADLSQTSYNTLHPAPFSQELAQTTSIDRHPRDNAITTASFEAGVFRRQSHNHASVVNADRNPITSAEISSAELAQDACPNTSSPVSMSVEDSHPLPSRGPVQTDPPWVALYLARERAEDRLWEEKLTSSVWITLRAVVGFGAARNAKDESKQSGNSVTGKSQTG